jgi:hypothetical protein
MTRNQPYLGVPVADDSQHKRRLRSAGWVHAHAHAAKVQGEGEAAACPQPSRAAHARGAVLSRLRPAAVQVTDEVQVPRVLDQVRLQRIWQAPE